jgi:hypothetical protein
MSKRRIYSRTMSRVSAGDGRTSGEGPKTREPPADNEPERNQGAAPVARSESVLVNRQIDRRAGSRRKIRMIRRLKLLTAFLILIIVFTAMGWILAWTKVRHLESEALQLDSDLRRTEIELEEVRAKLAQREIDVSNLVEERIPGLKKIKFNQLIDLNDEYLLNLTFSETGTEDDRVLEYHAVLRNETEGIVLPKIKIYLFDEYGVQVGMRAVERSQSTSLKNIAELSPGETRSYHSTVTLERGATPKFFMVHVE